MNCIRTIEDIRENMYTLDEYLDRKCESEYSFALDRIKRGTCFIAHKTDGNYRFYPSRFMGYANNTMDAHLNNTNKDGRITTPIISKILCQAPVYDAELDKAYRAYCEHLGFIASEKGNFGVTRKYWTLT